MQIIFSILIFTLIFTGFLSAKSKTVGEVKLRIAQEKAVPGTAIKIKFLSVVEDSRCPTGVKCIWAGVAKIKIQLGKNGKPAQSFELNTNQTDKTINFEGHQVKLKMLTPYPNSASIVKVPKYSATLTIIKLPK